MVSDARQISSAAVCLLVVLRLGIGWHLLYEGLWKIHTLKTPQPWSSEGYLRNSQGPLRKVFRSIAGDPDDLQWLDAAAVSARWDQWRVQFEQFYDLTDQQKSRLAQMVDGVTAFVAPLENLPAEIDFRKAGLAEKVTWDKSAKQLRVDGGWHLLPGERQSLEDQIAGREGPEYTAFRAALQDVFNRSARLSAKERLQAHLAGNPENAGLIEGRIGELDLYRQMVDRYEQRLTAASVAFEHDHVSRMAMETRSKAAAVAGPLKALDAELRSDAQEMLTVAQLQRGRLPAAWTPLRITDVLTIAGLAGFGSLLLLGLWSRLTALGAAFMLLGFYMAMPPWPGVPEPPGPEHSLIVNKNLVEILALLPLAFLPSGRWFGMDAMLHRLFSARRQPQPKSSPQNSAGPS